MGLGGVAIAVLPSVVYPKQSFSDRLGGVNKIEFYSKSVFIYLTTKTL